MHRWTTLTTSCEAHIVLNTSPTTTRTAHYRSRLLIVLSTALLVTTISAIQLRQNIVRLYQLPRQSISSPDRGIISSTCPSTQTVVRRRSRCTNTRQVFEIPHSSRSDPVWSGAREQTLEIATFCVYLISSRLKLQTFN